MNESYQLIGRLGRPTHSNTHEYERLAILHGLALHIGMPLGKCCTCRNLLHLLGLFPLLAPSHFL